jgi:hypothetical protein
MRGHRKGGGSNGGSNVSPPTRDTQLKKNFFFPKGNISTAETASIGATPFQVKRNTAQKKLHLLVPLFVSGA